jgi:hypothetical protein
MSAEPKKVGIELSIPQGTRDYAGDLIIGVGGLANNPPGAVLSIDDPRQRDRESNLVNMQVGESVEYDEWRVTLREIYRERGHGFARIAVELVGGDR